MTSRPLRVFLCHSSNDKPAVRELYQKLRAEAWIQPWLDEEDIFPGDDWNLEIQKAIRETDAIIVCLSKDSITKEGYVQREIKTALDYSDEKPERTVYIIPIRLEECKPPERLSRWHYADYFEGQQERGMQRLLISLGKRADSLGLKHGQPTPSQKKKLIEEILTQKKDDKPEDNRFEKSYARAQKFIAESNERVQKNIKGRKPVEAILVAQPEHLTADWIAKNKITLSNGMEFMRVPAGEFVMGIPKDQDVGFSNPQHIVDIKDDYWISRYLVTNELYNEYVIAKNTHHPVKDWEKKKDHPVTDLSRDATLEYCNWLAGFLVNEYPAGLTLRLPTEAEWEKAARGTDGRMYPWGNEFDKTKCNAHEAGIEDTTPVGLYTSKGGDSPYGCADMAGNVWEYTHSLWKKYPYSVNDGREDPYLIDASYAFRGGSFHATGLYRFCVTRGNNFYGKLNQVGFRVALAPKLPSKIINPLSTPTWESKLS